MIGFMKLQLRELPALQAYRLKVALRCCMAILIGFLIANLCIPLLGYVLPVLFAEISFAVATAQGFLLSFVVWLVYIIYVFSAKSLVRIFWLSMLIVLLQGSCIVAAKFWGQP